MIIAHLPGRLSAPARDFLDAVARHSGTDWGRAYARLFVGDTTRLPLGDREGFVGSHVTHIARDGQETIEGELPFLWRPGDPKERFQNFGRRR